MIQKTNLSEQYLSDWMSDQITDAQFQSLVSAEDFIIYQKIKSGSSQLQLTPPDMEQNWLELSQKLTQTQKISQPKVQSLWKYVGIAASILLLFGVYQFFGYTQSAIADIGSTKSVLLPDKSVVVLNSQSSIAYSKMFTMHRKIKLDGAAYFEVEKRKVFTVKTAYGEVEVLGTKFEVIARPDWFEVTCFEGKVKVKSGKNATILTPGKKIRIIDSQVEYQTETIPQPLWITGESGFKSVPFYVVLHALENQFGIQIQYPEKYKKVIFTGSFTHSNLDTALESICLPVNLQYNIKDSKVVLSETALNQN